MDEPRTVRRDEAAGRYELVEAGAVVGFAEFREGDRPGVVVLPHTVIDPDRRGEGLGAELVGAALDDLRDRGARIVPTCWYVREYLGEHPALLDLLA